MADRLTQLQDAVNVQANNLCNSLGILQQLARPTNFAELSSFNRSASQAYTQTLSEAGVVQPGDKSETSVNGTSGENNNETNGQPPPVDPLSVAENRVLFVKLITKTAKDIDVLIDSLPSKEADSDIQEAHIARLQAENLAEAEALAQAIEKAESLLATIHSALEDIALNVMTMKKLETRGTKHLN